MQSLGKQTDGQSGDAIYAMALRALAVAPVHSGVAVDAGAGAGNFTRILAEQFDRVHALDAFRPADLPANTAFHETDLNGPWPLADGIAHLLVALEVVEHLENPRHFFREIARILRPGGCGFVSTPNNHSLFSLLTFSPKASTARFRRHRTRRISRRF